MCLAAGYVNLGPLADGFYIMKYDQSDLNLARTDLVEVMVVVMVFVGFWYRRGKSMHYPESPKVSPG